jgi:hypothetical protein
VTISEVLIGTLILVATAFTFAAAGILFSSFFSRTLAPTILAYASSTLTIFGFPVILYTGLVIFGFFAPSGLAVEPTLAQQIILVIAGWTIVSLNPLAAAVASAVLLWEEQSLFFWTVPLNSPVNFQVVSPWISFTLLYPVLGLIMLYLSIRRVRRVEK